MPRGNVFAAKRARLQSHTWITRYASFYSETTIS